VSRGKDKHGSCGQGIGETRGYWIRHGEDAVFAADLCEPHVLRAKLELLRQRTLLDLQGFIDGIGTDYLRELDVWDLNTESVARRLSEAARTGVTFSAEVPVCRTAIFEGAQGVLLDEYRGFHPYATWSTVTPHHAWELVHQMAADAVTVLGVARAYTTRHGEGPLPTFSPGLTEKLLDPGNPWNRWQGSLRCGWLDLPLLRYAAAAAGPLDGIVVNHLDQVTDTDFSLCQGYKGAALCPSPAPNISWQRQLTEQLRQAEPILSPANADTILRALAELAPVVLTGFGPTHRERSLTELRFRNRKPND
jgi:adenylosuccinate synthase